MGLIRLLLALIVVHSHYDYGDLYLLTGHEAVQGFFVVSGFYMALVLDGKYTNARDFYRARLLRLAPMFYLATALSLFLLLAFDYHFSTTREELRALMADPLAAVLYVWWSLCALGQELSFSIGLDRVHGGLRVVSSSYQSLWKMAPVVQTWSLSLELVFYACAPLLVRLGTLRLLLVTAASLALAGLVHLTPYGDHVFFVRFAPMELWYFAAGILSYRLYKALPRQASSWDLFAVALLVLFVLGLGMGQGHWTRSMILAAALVALMPLAFRGLRSSGTDRMLGRMTYPLYLLHLLAVTAFERYLPEAPFWQVAIAALCLGLAGYCLVEIPLERMLRRRNGRVETTKRTAPLPLHHGLAAVPVAPSPVALKPDPAP